MEIKFENGSYALGDFPYPSVLAPCSFSGIAEQLKRGGRVNSVDLTLSPFRRNVFYMREFYIAYRDLPKVQPLVAQIGWTQNLIVLQRCRDPLEREFYIRMTKKFGWTKNVLIHQIENQSYEKTLLGQTNFDKALTPEVCCEMGL